MGAPIAVPTRSQRALRLPPHLPPFPRGGMGGDWPLCRVSCPPDRQIRETRRVLGHREGGRSRGCHLTEGPPSGPPTHVKPHSREWGLFRPPGGASPPGPPPLASLTIPHLIAPLMAQLLPASASARRSSLGSSSDTLRPLSAPPRCLAPPPPPPSRLWQQLPRILGALSTSELHW